MIEFLGTEWCWTNCTMQPKDWALGISICLLLGIIGGLLGIRR